MTPATIIVGKNATMSNDVADRQMTVLTELLRRLFQQPVIGTTMRRVAFRAAAAFKRIPVDGLVFIWIWPRLFRMTGTTGSVEIIGVVGVQSLNESVATEAGDGILHNWMAG